MVEIVGGLLLLFLTPVRIHNVLIMLTQEELSEDPGDFIANRIRHTANGLRALCLSVPSTSWCTGL